MDELPATSAEGGGASPVLAGDDTEVLDLDAFLPYRLSLLADLVGRGISATYERDFGLTTAQWRVLAAVARHPGATAQRIVAMTPMDKVQVSRAVARLCEQGLLARGACPRDGRSSLLSLTHRGLALYRAIAPRAAAYDRALQGALTPDEQRSLLELTARLIEAARSLERSAPRRAGERRRS